MEFTISVHVPDRSTTELNARECMISYIEGHVGMLEVEWCTMSTDSLKKLSEYIRESRK